MDDDLERLASLLASCRRILAFTGAGMSTGSGIPDFRGPSGLWRSRKPVLYQEFLASEEKRVEYWEYKAEGFAAFAAARPNAAHAALATLERRGVLHALVTQNIDGLHQAAGSSEEKVIELHGTNRLVECCSCGARLAPERPLAEFRATGRCPECSCGGWLKFATVSFGQPVPPDLLQRAGMAASRADLVLALGSTLSVQPAATIPLLAARRGVPYVIVNQGPTEHDALAQLRIEGDVTEVLPAAL